MADSFKRATFMVNDVTENLFLKPHGQSMDYILLVPYLNNENESNGGMLYEYEGTNINEPVREYITDSRKRMEMTGMVPMKFNRMVLYLQNVWHTAYVKPECLLMMCIDLIQQFFI